MTDIKTTLLTQKELKKQLHYDPDTGVFTRRISNIRVKAGGVAGGKDKQGYLGIQIKTVLYKAHRLAFLYMNGESPVADVDHINHNRLDNRWANLRAATRSENTRNTSIGKRNTSGFVGVTWDKRRSKWMAQIIVNRKNIYLGQFLQISDAVKARLDADVKYGFHPNHGGT